MKAKLGDVVAVDWLDAWYDESETNEADWKSSMPVTTYGVLRRDGETVTVVGETLEAGVVSKGTTHIPRGMVVKIRKLSE
jgi:hypothetical protein